MLPALGTWATTTNYPAGGNPWNGTATKSLPGYTYFTPGLAVGAAELNYLLNQLYSQDVAVAGVAVGAAVANYHIPVTAASLLTSSSWQRFTWDDTHKLWVGALSDGASNGKIVTTSDGGATWTVRSAIAAGTYALAANASVIVQGVLGSSGVASDLVNAITTGGTASNPIPDTLVRNSGTAFWSAAESLFYLYACNNSGASFASGTLVSTPNGTTLTQHTAPTGWVSATNHALNFFSAAGPSFALVALGGQTAGTDTARLAKVTAGTMTDISPALLSSKIILGLAYDASNALWLLTTFDGISTVVWSSPDSTTWTAATTFTAEELGPSAQSNTVAIDGIWLVIRNIAGFESGNAKPYISTDKGATWRETAAKAEPQSPSDILVAGTSSAIWGLSVEAAVSYSTG